MIVDTTRITNNGIIMNNLLSMLEFIPFKDQSFKHSVTEM